MTEGGAPEQSQLAAFVHQVYPQLERRSYYELLNVAANADPSTIRASFYRISAQLHPDRYFNVRDRALRDQLETIYARICEGYRVLTNPERRVAYDKGLPAGKIRLDTSTRESTGPKNPEDSLSHPQAKKFFRMALICLGRKDWKGAVMNLNFAKTFEPSSPLIAEKLTEAQAGLKGAPPGK